MEVSTEISQKIRSAIKAKLMELGAYVDDELPDYIMVMVANKRSRAQMKKDLGLFLGTNTTSFTGWLHGLLTKLQTIRSDLDKSADKQGKGGKLKTVEDKSEKQKGEKQIVDGLDSVTKQENKNTRSVEQSQTDSDGGEGNNYTNKDISDSKDTGSSSAKESLESKNEDNAILTDTPLTETVSEGEPMDTETVDLSIDSKISSASHSPGHGQPYSTSRKRKMESELADVSEESEAFHPQSSAFEITTSELTTNKSLSLQVTRALLLQAVAEVEHSIAVKRSGSGTKPPCRDDSYFEAYTPEGKRSHDCLQEENPHPYIPSNKSAATLKSCCHCISQSKDSNCTPVREDFRELISRCRREELLRSVGIVRHPSQPADSFELLTEEKSCQKGYEKVSFKPAVKSDRSSTNIQNFQVTTHEASPDLQHLALGRDRSQLEKCPTAEPGLPSVSAGSSASLNTRTSISSSLGKLVKERHDSFDDEDVFDAGNSRTGYVKDVFDAGKFRTGDVDDVFDAGKSRIGYVEDVFDAGKLRTGDVFDAGNSRTGDLQACFKLQKTSNSTAAQEKGNLIERLGKSSPGVSRMYQQQHAKDFMPVQETQTSRKSQKQSQSGGRAVFSDTCFQGKCIRGFARSSEGMGAALEHQHSQEAPAGVVESSNPRGGADPAEDGGVEDQEPPQLLDTDIADGCMFDSSACGTARWPTGDNARKHGSVETRKGITFIVTLDGVDESQFGSRSVDEVEPRHEIVQSKLSASEKVNGGEFDNLGSIFEKVYTGHFKNSGGKPEKIKCPAVSASAIVTPVVPSDLKQLWQEQIILLDLAAGVARPENRMLQQVQSLKQAAADPALLPLNSQLGLNDFETDPDEIAVEEYYSEEEMVDDEEGSFPHKQQKLERCKFWPACAAGSSCGYYHPTTHCKMFPKCRFGNKCLFIHPNCRFDSRCALADCPYTHSSWRQSSYVNNASVIIPQSHYVPPPPPRKPHLLCPAFSSSQPTCRYFPNCKNDNCLFVHPKLCRFGLTCKNLSCPFFHPSAPDKKMLTWQNHFGKVKVFKKH